MDNKNKISIEELEAEAERGITILSDSSFNILQHILENPKPPTPAMIALMSTPREPNRKEIIKAMDDHFDKQLAELANQINNGTESFQLYARRTPRNNK